MIIRRLHIDNFGCFHNFDLELVDQLNYFPWPNEGGKSTCMEFIRRIFWGFPDKRSKLNPYPALKGAGHYGGYLEVITSKGEILRLERRGERAPLKIISGDGSVNIVPDIGALSGMSETFYRNVCAITIDELTAFSALDDSEIRNRLYGSSLNSGQLSLSELQQLLADKAAELYKKRGVNHALKKLSDSFDASESALAQLSQHLPAYERALSKAEAIEKESQLLKEEIEKLLVEEKELEEQLFINERRLKLAEEEKRFAALTPPPAIPAPLLPFDRKAPEMPEFAELPEIPSEPQAPETKALEGKCDWRRAAVVEMADIADVNRWSIEYVCTPAMDKSKKVPLLLLPGATTALLLCAVTFFAGGSAAAGTVLLLCLLTFLACGIFFHLQKRRFNEAMNRKKELFINKFLLTPQLAPEEFSETLACLMKFQKEEQEYATRRSAFEVQKNKVEKIRFQNELRRQLYNEKSREYNAAKEEYENKRRRHEETCRSAAAALARYESEKISLAKRKNELPALPPSPAAPADLEVLRAKIRELKQKLEDNCRRSGAERRESALLLKGRDCAVELNIREQHRGEMGAAAERFLILTAARKLLERSVEQCERKHQPELLKQASRCFKAFTQNAYTLIYKQLSSNTLRVSNNETGADKGIGELSRGTREQLFLALRLALISSFESNGESLPVILDDILVNFDSTRKEAVRRGLEEFASTHQILLFECQ